MNSNSEHYQIRFQDISGKERPWEEREFPPIRPSVDHAVLFRVSKGPREKPPAPYKREGDRWDDHHVRLPQSMWNEYSKPWYLSNKTHRWTLIEKSYEKKIKDSKALIGAILKYNGKFKDDWKFEALQNYLNTYLTDIERQEFFDYTLPGIIKLALLLPSLVQAPIPLLKQNQNKSLSLSQVQIASLLANAFLCTFPRRNTAYPNSPAAKLPKINFASLYESQERSVNQKLRCICNYFRSVISKTPTGVVTFTRRFVRPFEWDGPPNWKTSDVLIKTIPVYVNSEVSIEDATGLIQVDFANKYVGGGVLGNGLVQEEISFLMYPELMAAMIFTESLGPQEALMIIGCQRYNNCTGYGHETFRWDGEHWDNTPVDSSGRHRCAVLAIDAELYWNPFDQFQRRKIERELTKAWIGFSFFRDDSNPDQLLYPGVATGNWGCGAFNGDPQLKSLIQIMAAAAARRPLAYYTFGDSYLKQNIEGAYDWFKKHDVTVGELFKCIVEYDGKMDLHSFLIENLEKELTQYRNAYKTYSITPQNAGTSTNDVDYSQNVASEIRHRGDHYNKSQRDHISGYHDRPHAYEHDTKQKPSNCQSSRKDGQHFQNVTEKYGRNDISEKECSQKHFFEENLMENVTQYSNADKTVPIIPQKARTITNDVDRSQSVASEIPYHGDHHNTSQRDHISDHHDKPYAYNLSEHNTKHERKNAGQHFQNVTEKYGRNDDSSEKSSPKHFYCNADKTVPIIPQNAGTITNDVDHLQNEAFNIHHQGDHYNTSQGNHMSKHHNRPPTNYTYDQSQHNTKNKPRNFQPSKNDGQRSQDMSEKCGRNGNSSKKKWTRKHHGGNSHSQHKMNRDDCTHNCQATKPPPQARIGSLTGGFTQMTNPIRKYSEVVIGTAKFPRQQDSSQIYEATGNMQAFVMRTAADGKARTGSASGEKISITAEILEAGEKISITAGILEAGENISFAAKVISGIKKVFN